MYICMYIYIFIYLIRQLHLNKRISRLLPERFSLARQAIKTHGIYLISTYKYGWKWCLILTPGPRGLAHPSHI